MKYTLKADTAPESVGRDDDQHETVLMGDDLTALKEVSELADSQPESSTESLEALTESPKDGWIAECQNEEGPTKPCVSRVIDADGNAKIKIILGGYERSKWLAQVIGLIDSASEKDVVDIVISPNVSGVCDTLSHRSLLSAIDRCKASVITRAGALTTIGDVALWLSGDKLQYSRGMTAIFMRQPITAYGGDVADYESKLSAAKQSYSEFSNYIVERGLFSREEMDSIYNTRGMLSLHGKELEHRVSSLKQVN